MGIHNPQMLELEKESRLALWRQVSDAVEAFADDLRELAVCRERQPRHRAASHLDAMDPPLHRTQGVSHAAGRGLARLPGDHHQHGATRRCVANRATRQRLAHRQPDAGPVVCFQDATHPEGAARTYLKSLARIVETGGRAWVSMTQLGDDTPALAPASPTFATTSARLASSSRSSNELVAWQGRSAAPAR